MYLETSTLLSVIDRSSRQNIYEYTVELNRTINQVDLIDIYRILHPTTEYTFFSSTHGTLTKIDHILDHEMHLNKCKLEIIQNVFLDDNRIKLEIIYRKIVRKAKMPKCLKSKQRATNKWVKEEISRGKRKIFN